jgi:hypothetical protein
METCLMLDTPARDVADPSPAPIDLVLADSVALRRLVEEVRNDAPATLTTAYNRTYHRHNR